VISFGVSRARCNGVAAGDGGAPQTRDPGLSKAAMGQTFYVYILASRYRGTLYVGVSNDIIRRVGEHKSGAVKAFTQRYKMNRLVYFEA
jgi:putative endonuclease